jgi:hypothetical protein
MLHFVVPPRLWSIPNVTNAAVLFRLIFGPLCTLVNEHDSLLGWKG